MKKFILLRFLAVIGVFVLSSNTVIEPALYGDDFTFPEYSNVLFIESSANGCSASCMAFGGGLNSCSGTGNCICSCSAFQCDCKATDPDTSTGYTEPQINISIDRVQYENLKELAYILYQAEDENAKQAYLHLGKIVETLKDKDVVNYHKQRDFYFSSLYGINSNKVKSRLNGFFEKIGLTDRV